MTIEQAMAMAVKHHHAGRLNEAAGIYRQILDHAPQHPQAQANLGIALAQMGQWRQAEAPARAAAELMPEAAGFHSNLGNILRELGKLPQAEAALRRAVSIDGQLVEAHANLGQVLYAQRRLKESADAYRAALKLNPSLVEALNGLGVVLRELREPVEAMECFRRALAANPSSAMAHSNLGMALGDRGLNEQAEREFRSAAEMEPGNAQLHSNLLYQLNLSEHPPREVYEEHLAWVARHEAPLTGEIKPHWNDRHPSQRLRVGYVSPDFQQHSVSYFLEPILANHDHASFEIHCFADEIAPDETTARLRGYADQWHATTAMNDAEAAELVRDQGIDILVDLAGHTARNRLVMFARKPAPIQVTYLGYPNTTGMKAMTYRLTDARADLPGVTEEWHSEKLWRLPRTFLSYQLPADAPEVGELPALKNGHVTFGYFGALPKLTAKIALLWGQLLTAVPGSRLLVKMRGEAARASVLEKLENNGVDSGRVDFVPQTQGLHEHLVQHGRLDIALDTFPYNGTTTTCEALAMGVPVITLAGVTHASRVGASLLGGVGLEQCVAASDVQYVQKAVELAGDLNQLADLRRGMRQRLVQSGLMDAIGFTRDLEKAYREMWRMRCEHEA
jgi:protein O-GlcNAc transferase